MILKYLDKNPELGGDVFVAPGAFIIGDVHIGDRASVWFGAVLRGDLLPILIGEETNIQDGCVLHVTSGKGRCMVGSRVTIGHGAVVHACTVEEECLIGMGAVILDGAVVEKHSMVAAGSVVRPGFRVPSGQLAAGNPAEIKRALSPKEIEGIRQSARDYMRLALNYMNIRKDPNTDADRGL